MAYNKNNMYTRYTRCKQRCAHIHTHLFVRLHNGHMAHRGKTFPRKTTIKGRPNHHNVIDNNIMSHGASLSLSLSQSLHTVFLIACNGISHHFIQYSAACTCMIWSSKCVDSINVFHRNKNKTIYWNLCQHVSAGCSFIAMTTLTWG